MRISLCAVVKAQYCNLLLSKIVSFKKDFLRGTKMSLSLHYWTSILSLIICILPGWGFAARDFSIGIEMPTQIPVTSAVENALREMGIDYINYYIFTDMNAPLNYSPETVNNEMIALCKRLKLDFSISVWVDLPEEIVRKSAKEPGFQGMVFDELEHIRLLMPQFGPESEHRNLLADPNSLASFDQADKAATAGFNRVCKQYTALGAPACVSTHVWPTLFHQAARGGMVVCPKISKEEYSPVSLAIALGSALQYNQPLWVDCDLWFYDMLPGHPPEEFKSNLLLAYWMGADRVYVEGSGFNLTPQGRQGIPFSLMTQITPDMAQLTAHGEVLRWFCREYVPKHPRTWSWRDVRPDIAIVRFEDTCHGQRFIGAENDRLFGSPHLKSTPDTEAWLSIWNVLTFGDTGSDGLTHFKKRIWMTLVPLPKGNHIGLWPGWQNQPISASQHDFFTPLNGVVVFDDQVRYEQLKDIPLLFITGVHISEQTMAAIRDCVKEGAICVVWGPLAQKHGFGDWQNGCKSYQTGRGRFIITDDFELPEVLDQIKRMLGSADTISYRFGPRRVTLHRGNSNNDISVDISVVK